jgi:hypothetical protein
MLRTRACLGAALALVLGAPAALAQDFGVKINAGSVTGSAKDITGGSGSFGLMGEAIFKVGPGSVVAQLGYRFYPGKFKTLSLMPAALPATGVNPSTFETRIRKAEVEGFELGGLYRMNAFTEGLYFQGGLRIGLNKTSETDTGTQIVTNGGAVGSGSNTNVLAVNTIADVKQKKQTAVGLLAGAGYQFTEKYSGEVNLYSTKFGSSYGAAKSGLGIEVSLGIRF